MSHRRRSVVNLAADQSGPSNSISLSASPEPPSSTARPSKSTPRGVKRRRSPDTSDNDDIFDEVLGLEGFDRNEIESIDLTGNTAIDRTAAKQTEDAIKAQQAESKDKTQSILAAYRCPICMDPPENATTTACGHLFCHACIIECLDRSSEQRFEANKNRGTCPVCRKSLSRSEVPGPRRGLVPLRLQLMTKKRNPVASEA